MSPVPGRVLVVDDEPALLKIIGFYLERMGYQVTALESTEKAWKEVDLAPGVFALAVLDASMAGLSMEHLALRILDANPSARVIAASGYPVDMSAMQSAAPGRVMFLQKPFSPEMLAAAVRRMLGPEEGV